MNRVKTVLIKNYLEILAFISLIIIFLVAAFWQWDFMGDVIIDCGREAYFPQAMNNGSILYKDLFNIFGPLSYQINAFLFSVLGPDLKTLRIAGTINAILILSALFGLSRCFLSRGLGWLATIFIMLSCFFVGSFFNYIFPYAYAIVYALNGFLFSILFLILFLKTKKDFFLPLSWLCLGFSFACKYEYSLYIIFLFFFSLLNPPSKKRYILFCFFSFFIIPFLSYFSLFLKGLTLKSLLSQIHYIKLYIKSPSLFYLYKNYVGLFPQKMHFFECFKIVLLKLFPLFGLFVSSFLFFSTENKLFLKKNLCLIFVAWFFYQFFSYFYSFYYFFCWLPLFVSALFIFLLFHFRRDIFSENFFGSKNGLFLIFVVCSCLASIKTFFWLNFGAYGCYTFPLLFLTFSIFITEYLPQIFNINKENIKHAFIITLFALIFSCCFLLSFKTKTLFSLTTEKGTLKTSLSQKIACEKAIKYIEHNLKTKETLWVVPEGGMINFLTNKTLNNIYYAINTPYIETFGESKIINDIKKTPPDYILVSNQKSDCYKFSIFCKDYGFKICKYIKSHYRPVHRFGKDFVLILYKKNF